MASTNLYRAGAFTPKSAYQSRPKSNYQSSAKKMEKFSFPLLSTKDILTCMDDLGLPILEAELLQPEKHAASIRRLLENVVEALIGVRKEEMAQPVFGPLQDLAWPQLHENSIPELAFWRECSRLMHICGVNDFIMTDYTKPDPKRLRKQLSAIVNFAKFKEERLDMYHKITAPRDEFLERHAQLTVENQQLETQLEELRDATAAQREEAAEIDRESHAHEKEIDTLNKEQAALRSESTELKKLSNELKERLGDLKKSHDISTAEVNKLQSQVVHSPERVRREMHESQRALQQERREGEAAEQAALVASTAAKVLGEAISRINDATAVCGEIESETSKWQESLNEIKTVEAEVGASKEATAEKTEAANNYERQRQRIEDRLEHLRAQSQTRSAAAADALDHAHAKLVNEQRKRREIDSQLQDENRLATALRQSMEDEKVAHEARIQEMVATWKRLEAAVESHQQSMLEAMIASEERSQATLGMPPVPTSTAGAMPPAAPVPAC